MYKDLKSYDSEERYYEFLTTSDTEFLIYVISNYDMEETMILMQELCDIECVSGLEYDYEELDIDEDEGDYFDYDLVELIDNLNMEASMN